jgi:hypothetical protein
MNTAIRLWYQFTTLSVPYSSLDRRLTMTLLCLHCERKLAKYTSCIRNVTASWFVSPSGYVWRKRQRNYTNTERLSDSLHFARLHLLAPVFILICSKEVCTVHVLLINTIFHTNGRIHWKTLKLLNFNSNATVTYYFLDRTNVVKSCGEICCNLIMAHRNWSLYRPFEAEARLKHI